MLKRISIFAVVLVMMISVFSFAAFAEDAVLADTVMMDIATAPEAIEDMVAETIDAAKDAVDAAEDASAELKTEKSMQFKPMAFVENLNIMGVGMLGIFVVIGAIILSVFVLNKLTSPKKKDE